MNTLVRMAAVESDSLVTSDVDGLYEELGRRITAIERVPSIAGSFKPAFDLPDLPSPADLVRLGKRCFNRLSGEAYKLTCSDDPDYQEQRKLIDDAYDKGEKAVQAALAAALISGVGIAPAIATVVAAIAIGLFFQTTRHAMCDAWKAKLPQPASA